MPQWFDVLADAFWLILLFGLWLWQFESSAQRSLYHWIVGAIGFVGAIGVILLAAVMLLTAFTSGRR
jgi:hypothetical protein